jgi:hypothetical protein
MQASGHVRVDADQLVLGLTFNSFLEGPAVKGSSARYCWSLQAS